MFHPTPLIFHFSPMTAKGTKMISSDVGMCIASISVQSQAFHLPVKWKQLD